MGTKGQLGIVAAVCACAVLAGPVMGASERTSSGLLKSHTRLIDQRLASQYSGSAERQKGWSGYEPIPGYSGAYSGTYMPLAESAARKYGVPEDLFKRLVQQESNWNPNARSPKGAIGLAQLMPTTARRLGVNPHDAVENLDGGARYLKQQYNRFRSWRLALAAYNAGPEAVEKYNGVPPYKETKAYVRKILGQ